MNLQVELKCAEHEKNFFYIGFYENLEKEVVLKFGTTNNMRRRAQEHKRINKKLVNYPAGEITSFECLWSIKVAQSTALKLERDFREVIKEFKDAEFIRNDRAIIKGEMPEKILIKIKKFYEIPLKEEIEKRLKKESVKE